MKIAAAIGLIVALAAAGALAVIYSGVYDIAATTPHFAVTICDPRELARKDARLWNGSQPIDFVYNRLTDFALEQPAQTALKLAYLAREVVVSPHPRAHMLYADKRNLTLLCDEAFLRETGVADDAMSTLLAAIPRTVIIRAGNRNALWAKRRELFFKPTAGYGSKAAYRGEKLTKRVWEKIAKSPYVAQALIAPSERHVADIQTFKTLKADVRNYAYAGAVKLVAARLYQGPRTFARLEEASRRYLRKRHNFGPTRFIERPIGC